MTAVRKAPEGAKIPDTKQATFDAVKALRAAAQEVKKASYAELMQAYHNMEREDFIRELIRTVRANGGNVSSSDFASTTKLERTINREVALGILDDLTTWGRLRDPR